MRAMGAPEEVIEAVCGQQAVEDEVCWVHDDNWDSVVFFFGLGTQWTMAGMGGYCGLSYAGVEACLRMSGLKRRRRARLFEDVRIMEHAALPVLNRDKGKGTR